MRLLRINPLQWTVLLLLANLALSFAPKPTVAYEVSAPHGICKACGGCPPYQCGCWCEWSVPYECDEWYDCPALYPQYCGT